METTITNALQTFTNEDLNANIRVVEIDGQPWFVATDVCKTLELTNPTVAISRLDEDELQAIFDMTTMAFTASFWAWLLILLR